MKTFWLFRTNLRQLEYYHQYTNLEEFKLKCHDFYLLQGIWFLENGIFDEVVIWRLSPKNIYYRQEIIFIVNGKRFIQRFVNNFNECISAGYIPDVTFFRGGFREYGDLTSTYSKLFGKSLYCGTGKRVYPQHGGKYSKILVEDERDIKEGCIKFYKTANAEIFKQLLVEKKYDICWPCNFSQVMYKGQEWFIRQVSKSAYLQSLKIIHVGNKPETGRGLCKRYNVKNIHFMGQTDRPNLNIILNQSKCALVSSNQSDGCPRIITEILASGTLLLLRDLTRALQYYRLYDIELNEDNLIHATRLAIESGGVRAALLSSNMDKLSMATICRLNLKEWEINA
jgi:hypothetical protein